jgi:hypothetical protein
VADKRVPAGYGVCRNQDYRVGDEIHLYNTDEGFEIVKIEKATHEPFGIDKGGETYWFYVKRKGGRSTWIYRCGHHTGWLGRSPSWKKVKS